MAAMSTGAQELGFRKTAEVVPWAQNRLDLPYAEVAEAVHALNRTVHRRKPGDSGPEVVPRHGAALDSPHDG